MSVFPHLLKGQKALVIGATSGLAEAVAPYLAQAEAAVAINYHSHFEAAAEIVDGIKAVDSEQVVE